MEKNLAKTNYANFPTILSPSQTSKLEALSQLPFFHFMWEKIHEAHETVIS